MSTTIRAVGFDLGGVLAAYTMPQQLKAMAEKMQISHEAFLTSFNERRQILETGRLDEGIFWQGVSTDLGGSLPGEVLRDYWNSWYSEHNFITTDMLGLVDRLKANGYRVGLLSNIDPDHAATNRARGILAHFDAVVLSTEYRLLKPNEAAYAALSRQLDVAYQELVFIDDSPVNVTAAEALGIAAILFSSYDQVVTELDRLGVRSGE